MATTDLPAGADGLPDLADPSLERIGRLAPYKVKKFLLVASRYDLFMLEEDGRLQDLLLQSYQQWNRGYVPQFVRVSGGENALQRVRQEPFDLVVAVMRLGDMDPFQFGRQVRAAAPGLPVVGLAYNTPELKRLLELDDGSALEKIFVWQGDGNLLPGIIQFIEDRRNAAGDTRLAGVQNILLIEDSPGFYSSYLPLIFAVLRRLTEGLLKEDLTFTQRLLRQNARPRVQLATRYDEAAAFFAEFKDSLLGVITDASFPRAAGGEVDPRAGLEFARVARGRRPSLPILLQSSDEGAEELARQAGLPFLSKNSPTLLRDLERFLAERFGFGDLVLAGDGARFANLDQLYSGSAELPAPALAAAVASGALDRWLRARTEFALADALRLEFAAGAGADAGTRLRRRIAASRAASRRGAIVPYSRSFHEEHAQFSIIGSGSIGGKARGLAFMDRILAASFTEGRYPGVTVAIPRTLVLGTDVFDDFMRQNDLLPQAVLDHSDAHLASLFIKASLPSRFVGDLRDFIRQVKAPLAVRSSSLLEDSLYQPFAGIYATKMLPNDQDGEDIRFLNLVNAIKFVYASTFFRQAKAYIASTPHRVEDEKMAVIIQPVVGRRHPDCFYPDLSGVARSYNFYPVGPARPEDGVVNVALGLGKTVVDGGVSLRFTPAFAGILPQFASIKDMFQFSQRDFYAVAMRRQDSVAFLEEDQYLVKFGLDKAETDGALEYLASTYSRENDAVYDGISAEGPRILNFAHILKNNAFPLAAIVGDLLQLGREAMNCAVEIEFAAAFDGPEVYPARFSLLQVRPLVVQDELVQVELDDALRQAAFCSSDRVLGNGVTRGLRDIVFVKPQVFDASRSPQIAGEVDQLNARLSRENAPYVLIGPGRWGSTDPWLGIPVKWSQISGVRVVVEAAQPNMNVDPSQGSHFFQNMTSLRIGYFTVPLDRGHGFIDWAWLDSLPVAFESEHLRHVRLGEPLAVVIDGRRGQGVILKPGAPVPGPNA
ncbi:MAG TPA: PEP/pyruvate-binding domain-containing protein [Candidatus Aminicenantes bacterium]|nr:PEP/pyruvate-binding domain-containing protein [Candidatus Aminicenantes bacterium]